MKQILSLALALLPCLAWAQYPSNGNQKITLGEQTTADGLIWRGVAADTTLTVKSDTAAYFVLDTANLNLYTYKASATGRKWIQLGSDTTSLNLVSRFAAKLNISDTASMLTNYYRSGRTGIIQATDVPTLNQNTTGSAATLTTSRTFQTNLASTSTASFNGSANVTPGVTGTLPVANGGTNTSTAFTAGSVVFAGSGGTYTQDNSGLFYDNTEDRLGIGTTSPSDKLHIVGAARLSSVGAILIISLSGIGSPSYILFDATAEPTGAKWRFGYTGFATADKFSLGNQTKNLIGFSVDSLCNFGIKTASPTEALHVVGNGRFTSVGAGTFSNNLNITSDGTLTTATSDEKFKYNIRPINYGLSTLLQLKPVNFQWIEGEEEDLGFIAQDVAEIIPEAVNTNWNSDLLFRYESLIPILTKAIQEQQALIKALEQRIINLENK